MDQEDEIDPRFELRLGAGRPLPEAIADKIREFVDNGMATLAGSTPRRMKSSSSFLIDRSRARSTCGLPTTRLSLMTTATNSESRHVGGRGRW